MDVDAEKEKLQAQKDWIQGYLDHPLSKAVLLDNQEEQDKAIQLICNVDVDSIGAFFAHWAAVGHLRGLRRAKSLIMDKMDEVEQQLKEIQE